MGIRVTNITLDIDIVTEFEFLKFINAYINWMDDYHRRFVTNADEVGNTILREVKLLKEQTKLTSELQNWLNRSKSTGSRLTPGIVRMLEVTECEKDDRYGERWKNSIERLYHILEEQKQISGMEFIHDDKVFVARGPIVRFPFVYLGAGYCLEALDKETGKLVYFSNYVYRGNETTSNSI